MTTVTTRTFRSGNSEAVRLPKEVAFGPDTELEVTRNGDVVTLRPRRTKWDPKRLVAQLRAIGAPADGVQPREPFDFPDRG